MNRRDAVLALVALGAAPLVADAQQPAKVARIGYLSPEASDAKVDTAPETALNTDAFSQSLRAHGYVEGRNLIIEWRFADGRFERLPDLAADLVRLKVDVIVTGGTPAITAAKNATATIPIVMLGAGDPVGSGFVKSLARPETNITGLSIVSVDVGPKELELLVAVVPRLARVAYLVNPANPVSGAMLKGVLTAASMVGINVFAVEVRSAQEMENAFAIAKKQDADAVIVQGDTLFIRNADLVANLAAKHRLPSISAFLEYVKAGGLMSYGPNLVDGWRRAAVYVDKILKGARPGDLAVEQPMRIELEINARTARALGLTIPQFILLRADRVIE